MRKTISLITIALFLGGCRNTYPNLNDQTPHSDDSPLFETVYYTLEHRNQTGSIVYQGTCTDWGGMAEPFVIGTPGGQPSAVDALHEAFAKDRSLVVREESGFIRVIGGSVKRDLLDQRIAQITVKNADNPMPVVTQLLSAPEVQTYIKDHSIGFVTVPEGLSVPKTKDSPHMNLTMKNISVSDVLDNIAQTFPGFWVYGECNRGDGKRHVLLEFYYFPLPYKTSAK
jgi:hypothetical protein